MTTVQPPPASQDQPDVVHELCDMLLEIAGRDTNRLPSVIRHVRILDQASAHMTPAQRAEALVRITRLQTKWGCLFSEDESEGEIFAIPPEKRVANWLSERKHPERYLRIMHLAAKAVWAGETSISLILDSAYQCEDDGIVAWVGFDSFKEWLLQLRIVRREAKGFYQPGVLCRWWCEEMRPTRASQSTYAACLKLLRGRNRH